MPAPQRPRCAAAGAAAHAGGLLGGLPVELMQSLFAGIEPLAVARKFAALRRARPGPPQAQSFVAIEDWLNDGVALGAGVAHECLRGWYGENRPARGALAARRSGGAARSASRRRAWSRSRPATASCRRPRRRRSPRALPRRDAAAARWRPRRHGRRRQRRARAVDAAGRLAAADCCDAKMTLAMPRAIAYIAVNRKLCRSLVAQPVPRPARGDLDTDPAGEMQCLRS